MKIAVIGTGNMGTGLGRQFAGAGYEVVVGGGTDRALGIVHR